MVTAQMAETYGVQLRKRSACASTTPRTVILLT